MAPASVASAMVGMTSAEPRLAAQAYAAAAS
jgi:hypothetical protein